MHRVFVYGTLKRGFCRHQALADQTFLGLATTKPQYRLFDLGEYPGMTECSPGDSIEGEIYQVNESCLHLLDEVEGVADGYYERKQVLLLEPWDSEPALAYIYKLSVDGCPKILKW